MRAPDSEDTPSNPDPRDTIGEVIERRLNRRQVIRRLLGLGVLGACAPHRLAAGQDPGSVAHRHATAGPVSGFRFREIARGVDATHHVAPGYRADILIRWGDPVIRGAPPFDPHRQTLPAQRGQFGYNNDFIGFVPLPAGSDNAERGLLCVNHEYTIARLMFPGGAARASHLGREQVEIEMASHGGSIIEVAKHAGRWQVIADSGFARRINALDSALRIAGPAAGHRRMRTAADPQGLWVIGTLNNCAGGITPWGTYLMAEENFNKYFSGRRHRHPEPEHLARYGVPAAGFAWSRYHRRFDIDHEPNEPNRFGWIVEVDPLDPTATPVKRTALGRFKHEGAACIVNRDGRLVIYSADDQQFEFLYRFVTHDRVDPTRREVNRDLLDHGTLSVARFGDDGMLQWLPLVYGHSGLDEANGFHDQGDVVIGARRAASLLGATPLDRPEDVEPNPLNGKVYLMLTGHSQRARDAVDAVNPRTDNLAGHIIEISPAGGDHAAAGAGWEILIRAGNPADPTVGAAWNPATSDDGWFACPDNCAIDPAGRLWVCTDQAGAWQRASGGADGVWALHTAGERRGTGRMFFRAPVGAEMTGPCFTPDGKTLFVSVQHPGAEGTRDYRAFGRRSTFDDPATRWPDFDPNMPPRPAVVAITRDDGGTIGD